MENQWAWFCLLLNNDSNFRKLSLEKQIQFPFIH